MLAGVTKPTSQPAVRRVALRVRSNGMPIMRPGDAWMLPQVGLYSATVCVPKKKLYASVKELRKVRPLPSLPVRFDDLAPVVT